MSDGRDSALRVSAWAKVNLTLQVTGRRSDGYHEIDSLIVFAGLGDRLSLAPAERLTLEVSGPLAGVVPAGQGNLACRAAEALAEACGVSQGAAIHLEKHLPAAAGLGGGSADAAAVLTGLQALWGTELPAARLAELALGLGADLPVCLFGRPALVTGIGERIRRAPPLPPAWLLLVNPGVALATAEVFAALSENLSGGDFSAPAPWTETPEDAAALAAVLAARGNDLEVPARALAPVLDEVLARIAALPQALLARMSGSGATCFGLFAARAEAMEAAAALAAERPDWWVRTAPLLHGPLDRLRVAEAAV